MKEDIHYVVDSETIVFDHDHELLKKKCHHDCTNHHQDSDVDIFDIVFSYYISICNSGHKSIREIEGHDIPLNFAEHFDGSIALRVELIVDWIS